MSNRISLSLRLTPIISDISFTSNAGLSFVTTGIPVISRQSLRAYCSSSSNLTSTLKPSLPSLFMSSLIYLIWLFTPSLCSFTALIADITVSYFFEIKLWDFSISSNFFLRSRRLALSESISLRISFRILGRNSFAHSSFKLSTVKLTLWVKFCTLKLLNSVLLNSPLV